MLNAVFIIFMLNLLITKNMHKITTTYHLKLPLRIKVVFLINGDDRQHRGHGHVRLLHLLLHVHQLLQCQK